MSDRRPLPHRVRRTWRSAARRATRRAASASSRGRRRARCRATGTRRSSRSSSSRRARAPRTDRRALPRADRRWPSRTAGRKKLPPAGRWIGERDRGRRSARRSAMHRHVEPLQPEVLAVGAPRRVLHPQAARAIEIDDRRRPAFAEARRVEHAAGRSGTRGRRRRRSARPGRRPRWRR